MQTAQLADGFVAGAQKQVVGVGQQKLCAQLLQHRLRQRLHRARRPHRHEHGRVHHSVGGVQPAHTRRRARVTRYNFKPKLGGRIHSS